MRYINVRKTLPSKRRDGGGSSFLLKLWTESWHDGTTRNVLLLNTSVEKKSGFRNREWRKSCSVLAFIIITYIAIHKVTLQALEIHTKTKPFPEVASYFLWVNTIWISILLNSRDGAKRAAEDKLQGVKWKDSRNKEVHWEKRAMVLPKALWWYKPKHTQKERESTGCAMAKGWLTQLRASSSPDKKKCGMSQKYWMMSFQSQSRII